MEIIQGYSITSDWTRSANGCYAFAKKGDDGFFIKEFPTPVQPSIKYLSEDVYRRLRGDCAVWEKDRRGMISGIAAAAVKAPCIVAPVDLFCHERKYYMVSRKVEGTVLDAKEVSDLPEADKICILRQLAAAFAALGEQGIVHGDVKKENVMVTLEGS